MKTAIFLGAGASKADGAPLQNELFREYFKQSQPNISKMKRELQTFFNQMFGIDFDIDDLDEIVFPTFEEAIGILDLAVIRNETFKKYNRDNIADLRKYLVFSMSEVINDKLKNPNGVHKKLIDNLKSSKLLQDTVFISTNYDILIDNALNPNIDYGIDFMNAPEKTDDLVQLFKVHGSLNWLYCPTCNKVTLTGREKGVIRLMTDVNRNNCCSRCGSLFMPIITPPTYFKNMNNVFLSNIWNKVENAFQDIDHLIFCGYSFPDADIHIKYLLKRVQTNRNKALAITVCNNHKNKKKELRDNEKERFKRFLGNKVLYTDTTFEDFACNPLKYWNRQVVS